MNETELIYAALALTAAGVVKGVSGIGYATIALPLLVAIVGLPTAMGLIVAPTLATNIGLAVTGGHLREQLRAFAPMYLAILPGVAVGTLLRAEIEVQTACTVLGICLLLYVGVAITRPSWHLPPRLAKMLRAPVGLATGILTGLTGAQVFPLVPFIMAAETDAAKAVQATNLGVLLLSSSLGISLISSGVADQSLLAASALAVLPALTGSAVGVLMRRWFSQGVLRFIVLLVVALSGVKLAMG
jgi:uncharacterized protein